MPSLRRALHRPVDRTAGWALALALAAGLLGAWPRAGAGPDPFALLAWVVLIAPAAGFACGAAGVRLLPLGILPPAGWMVIAVQVDLAGDRDVAAPIAPGLVWTGLFLLGLGLGAAAPRRALAAGTGALALAGATLALAASAGGKLVAGHLAAARPGLVARLCDVSPLALAFDAARWDWSHANPDVYVLAGAEWVARAPFDGALAAAGALVVGCTSAAILALLGERGERPARN